MLKSTGYKAPREEIVDVFISGNKSSLDKLLQIEKKNGPSPGKPLVHYGINEHQKFIDGVREIVT